MSVMLPVRAAQAAQAAEAGSPDPQAPELDTQATVLPADLERRFGGLRRLYGDQAYLRLRQGKAAVVGVGGVGSWAAEALARSGLRSLVLIDLDHVAESNINRQVQALGSTLGQAKVQALKQRILDLHPGCQVHAVEAFVAPEDWPALLPIDVDVVIDACDQVHAKLALVSWSKRSGVPVVCVGAAGGKRQPQSVEVQDLALVTHDPLLASLRQRWRKAGDGARQGPMGVRCVFSREAVQGSLLGDGVGSADAVADASATVAATSGDGSLNCHGYGSSVTVTATFGMVAAAEAMRTWVDSTEPAAKRVIL